jgi:ATP-dependent DNA helicase RecG
MDWYSPLNALFKTPKTKSCRLLGEAGYNTICDLLDIFPNKITIVPPRMPFNLAKHNELFCGHGSIDKIQKKYNYSKNGRSFRKNNVILSVIINDSLSKDSMELTWFSCYPALINKLEELKLAAHDIYFQGFVTFYKNRPQIITPKINVQENKDNVLIEYPTINGLSHKDIKKVVDRIPPELWKNIDETLPPRVIVERNILEKKTWAQIIHGKKVENIKEEDIAKAQYRTVYESYFKKISQNFKIKKRLQKVKAPNIAIDQSELNSIYSLFPFELTLDQKKVIDEIKIDLNSSKPMMRLLQGDVGSGKTCIAIFSSCLAIKSGYQVALMCPTEALAQQHFLEMKSILGKMYSIEIILGSLKESKKALIKDQLKKGLINLIIGTHALIQDSIQFKKLGLSIIDEQHKFGVNQKKRLVEKSIGSHSLYMSATPIPRTLKLAQYGQLDLSTIKELPSNKKEIKTKLINKENFNKYLNFLKTRISMGEQAYIVVPLINSSSQEDDNEIYLKSISKKFKTIFPKFRVQEYHGEQTISIKEETLKSFSRGDIDILIATSIIEVGINVTNATVMSIFRPERFGLSSLHQLRGRVGRGGKPGFCFIIQNNHWSEQTKQRVSIFEKTTNGFIIAEEDLRIRGQGDIIGTKQSGNAPFKNFEQFYQIDESFLSNVEKDVMKYFN